MISKRQYFEYTCYICLILKSHYSLAHLIVLSPVSLWVPGTVLSWGFPGGASGEEPACQCRSCQRRGFDPWVGKIPWRRKWQSTPVFLPGKSHRQEEPGRPQRWGHKESDTTEWLTLYLLVWVCRGGAEEELARGKEVVISQLLGTQKPSQRSSHPVGQVVQGARQ